MEKFKMLIEEQNRLELLKSRDELTDRGLQMLTELNQALQLLQSRVSKSVCNHCNNKLCDSQTFNQQCFKCGKKLL